MEQKNSENSIWKDKYALLLKEIESVKQEKEMLIKHYEEKVLQCKNEIKIEKHGAKLKEIEFEEKLQVYEASIALQYDELQSTHQARLDSVNQQLKDSNTNCHILRNQLEELKNRFSSSNIESERRILELQQSVTTAEEKLRSVEEKLIANRQTNIPTYRGTKLNLYSQNKSHKYTILRSRSAFSNEAINALPSSSSFTREYEPLELKTTKELSKDDTLTEVKSSPNRKKRRKLYNVDEFIE